MLRKLSTLFVIACLAACTQAPPVESSQEVLWQKYGHQSIDSVLLAWGSPASETRLTDGSRLVTYRHTTLMNAGTRYEQAVGCEVTLLAKSPSFQIDNIAMKGDAYECQILAGGRTGQAMTDYPAPPGPTMYHPYMGGPRF